MGGIREGAVPPIGVWWWAMSVGYVCGRDASGGGLRLTGGLSRRSYYVVKSSGVPARFRFPAH